MRRLLLVVVLFALALTGCNGGPDQSLNNAKGESASEYFSLEIVDIDYIDDKILVTGTTNLPEGSNLSISLDVAGSPETSAPIGVTRGTEVINGKFSTELEPPNHPEFIGPYIVDALFTPRGQSEPVLKLVGKDGEFLKGDNVQESFTYNVIRVSQEVEIELKISSEKSQSLIESDKLKVYVDSLKSIFDSINQKYSEQKNNYDKFEWASFVNETRVNIDKNREAFNEEFHVGAVLPENVRKVFIVNDLYIKIQVDLIKKMCNELDGGTQGDIQAVQAVQNEIISLFSSIELQ